MTNSLTNRVAFQLSADELATVMAAVKILQDKLRPQLVTLDAEDRKKLPKMGPRSIDFVAKTYSYGQANPQYVPTFVDVSALGIDLAAVGTLREILQPLQQLVDMIGDTLLLSGSEAMAASLAIYDAFKSAAKVKAPGAVSIAEDLAVRFAARSSKSEEGTPSSATPSSHDDSTR